MKRRRYVRTVGSGLCVGLVGIAGCGSPGEEAGTETVAMAGNETETTTAGGDTAANATNETGTETGGTDAGSNTIAMVTDGDQYYFDPIGLYVDPGGDVTWENQAGSHSATAYVEENPQAEVRRIPEDAEGWNSETISEEGETFSHTFEVEGTYDYYCIPHKSLAMVGRIVVGEPSGLEDDPPDGPVPDEQTIVEEEVVSYDQFESG